MSDEYDAFGRKKKDESGLGDLGWGASDKPSATPNPAPPPVTVSTSTNPVPPPPVTEFRTVQPLPPGLSSPRRNPAIILVQLAVLGGIVAAVYFAVSAGNDATKTARDAINQFNGFGSGSGSGSGTKGSGSSHKVPKQQAARNLFTPTGLRSALKVLEREQPGKITNFSMRDNRVDIQVVRNGRTHIIDFPSDAEVPSELSVSTATSLDSSFTYEELNVTAPQRLMRAANARLNQSPADVDYFVASRDFGGSGITWGIYYKNGKPIAQGDSRGRYLRRIS